MACELCAIAAESVSAPRIAGRGSLPLRPVQLLMARCAYSSANGVFLNTVAAWCALSGVLAGLRAGREPYLPINTQALCEGVRSV